MSPSEFNVEMNRLVSQFGKAAYSPERANIIWNEVRSVEGRVFKRIVDELIGNSRYAPLISDFREKLALDRERSWGNEKKQYAQDAYDWANCTLVPEETKIVCQAIVARVRRKMSDHDWESFIKGLQGLTRGKSA